MTGEIIRHDSFMPTEAVTDPLTTEYNALVGNLRQSIETKHVSFIDSNAFEIACFLREHPGFMSEDEVEVKFEALNAIVKSAWKVPGWEDAVAGLQRQRVDTSNPFIV